MKKSALLVVLMIAFYFNGQSQSSINLNYGEVNKYEESSGSKSNDLTLRDSKRYRNIALNPILQSSDNINVHDTILLDLFNDRKYKALIDKISEDVNGTLVIRAKLTGFKYGYCIISTNEDKSLMTMDIPENNEYYKVKYDHRAKKHLLLEIDEKKKDYLEGAPSVIPPVNDKDQDKLKKNDEDKLTDKLTGSITTDSKNSPGSSVVLNDENSQDIITLLIVYTPAAASWASTNETSINNTISSLMAKAEIALNNSNSLLTLNLVHSEQVAYTELNNSTDLYNLQGSTDGFMDNVHTLRNDHDADLVVLLENISYTGGQGYLLMNPAGSPNYGFSLTRVQQASWTYTTIHEIGHNLGCHHHKLQNTQPGPGIFSYSAGWRWTDPDGGNYCSVMTYESGTYFDDGITHTRVPYFSDPDVRYLDEPTGNSVDADNSRTIRETKAVVSSYRTGTPSVVMVTPNGGEELLVGTTCTIRWAVSNEVETSSLYYSTDGGSTFTMIDAAGEGITSYNWTVPNTPSDLCRVEVIGRDVAGTFSVYDMSDQNFTISSQPAHICDILDQSQVSVNYGFYFTNTVKRWQEFKPSLPLLGAIDVHLSIQGLQGDLIANIKDRNENIVATKVIKEQDVIISTGWLKFVFDNPVVLDINNIYRIEVYGSKAAVGSNYYFWNGTTSSTYNPLCFNDVSGSWPDYDYAFRTFTCISEPCSEITAIAGIGSGFSQTFTSGGSGFWFSTSANPCGNISPGREKIYSFIAPESRNYSIRITNADGYVNYLWKEGSCSSVGWNCIDNINGTGAYGSLSWTAGTTYFILLDDENTLAGSHTFYIDYLTSQSKTLGNTEIYSLSSTTANRRAQTVTFPEPGTIQSISIYHNGGTGQVLLGLYADAAGVPGARLGVTPTTTISTSAGWQTVSLTSPVTVTSGQKVWLSWVFENNPGIRYEAGTPARAQSTALWTGGMPDPFGSSSLANYRYSVYCTYLPGGTETKTNGITEVYDLTSTTANRRAQTITFAEAGTIQSISIYHNGGTGQVLLGVYADAAGVPGARLGVTPETNISSSEGWQTVTLTSPVTATSGQKVWLSWVFENNPGIRYISGTPARAQSAALWSGGMPDPFGSSSLANYRYSVYCTYIAAGTETKTNGITEVYGLTSTTANRRAQTITFTEAGTIQSISIYHNGGTGQVLLGVYADAADVPGARLGVTPETNISSSEGWQTVTLTSPVTVTSGQKVWLSWVFENNPGIRYITGIPARAQSAALWPGGMPDPFGSSSLANYRYSVYCTYIPAGTETKTNGITEVYGLTSTTANRRAQTITFTESGTIQSISIYHNGGTGQVLLGVYADASGVPGARLGVTPATTISSTAGWQTIPLSSPYSIASGQKVWLSWVFQTNPGVRYVTGTPARAQSTALWAGGMPDPFGSSTFANYRYSVYCTYTTGMDDEVRSENEPLKISSANQSEEEVLIYPNPTYGEVTVKWQNNHESRLTLTIYDLHGRPVKILQIEPDITEINVDLSEFRYGIYLFELKESRNNLVMKRSKVVKY